MIDGVSKFDADKAYKDSKLCNILFAKELANQLFLKGKNIPIIAWAPGLVIPRSKEGFFRYSRQYNEIGQRLFSLVVRDLLRITETPKKAGELLSRLAIDPDYVNKGFSYFSNKVISPGTRIFEESEISKEASDQIIAKALWEATDEIIHNFIASKV